MDEIFIDDTPFDYSTLPDFSPEECDRILEEERNRLKNIEKTSD